LLTRTVNTVAKALTKRYTHYAHALVEVSVHLPSHSFFAPAGAQGLKYQCSVGIITVAMVKFKRQLSSKSSSTTNIY